MKIYGRHIKSYRNQKWYVCYQIACIITGKEKGALQDLDFSEQKIEWLEAVKEMENKLLGVNTNITNWQRRQKCK